MDALRCLFLSGLVLGFKASRPDEVDELGPCLECFGMLTNESQEHFLNQKARKPTG